jgi:hypothetical protein
MPRTGDKKADFKIIIAGTDIFIEVVTPRLPQKDDALFQEIPTAGTYDPTIGIVNHAGLFHPIEQKIIGEYEHHFKVYEPSFNIPTTFIVDTTYVHSETRGLFGIPDFNSFFSRYHFPDYVIGILDYWTTYNDNRAKKISIFYFNPKFIGSPKIQTQLSELMIPTITQRFLNYFP